MSYICAIGTATPHNKFDQSILGEFMVKAMDADLSETRKIRAVFKASGIQCRYSVLDDYAKADTFQNGNHPLRGTESRMQLYREHALPLSIAAINNLKVSINEFSVNEVTHLVLVSCTGMYAPGLDIDIIRFFNLNHSIERTCINFMGCYAALNGLKSADFICRSDPSAKVLIVCVELCSVHFQHQPTDDNILANALFSDGAAAMLVEGQTLRKRKLSIEKFHSDLALNGGGDMAWSIGNSGFEMKLSAYVPDLIKKEINKLVTSLLKKLNMKKEDIKYFCFHPGGKKILQAIEQELKIGKNENTFAYEVLRDYGNMSSPTVVFVLKKIFEQLRPTDNNAYILGAAFGPGLTLESMIVKAEVES